jgi:hypothetical protein
MEWHSLSYQVQCLVSLDAEQSSCPWLILIVSPGLPVKLRPAHPKPMSGAFSDEITVLFEKHWEVLF